MYWIVSIQTHFTLHTIVKIRTSSRNVDLRINANLFKECLFWVHDILRRIGSAKRDFYTLFSKSEIMDKCFEYYVILNSVWSKNCKERTNLYGQYNTLQDV